MTPTLTVTPGQRPLSACSSRTSRRRLEDRAAALLGLHAACAARPWIVTRASTMPLRADTMSPLARAHSRTRHASASAASARMCGVELGDPISSSGLATNVSRSNGRPAAAASERLERVQARPAGPPSCR